MRSEVRRRLPAGAQLVAIDLDGTLLDSSHRVPATNRDALHRAHAAGLRIVLCTGRSFTETRDILEQIGLDLDATVTVFGALISDARSGATLERTAMDAVVAVEFTHWLMSYGYAVLWLTDPHQAGHDGYAFDGPRRHPAYDRWLEMSPCRVERRSAPDRNLTPPLRISIIDERGSLQAMSAELAARFAGRVAHNVLDAPSYDLTVIECFAPQINKWVGVERLCRRWGLDPARTVAVGDDVNDVALLCGAGLGVAMGNARPEARAAATLTTGTNDEFGVATLLDAVLAALPAPSGSRDGPPGRAARAPAAQMPAGESPSC